MKTTFGEYTWLLRNENELTQLAKILKLNLTELRNEYITDQIGKHIYETNCTK